MTWGSSAQYGKAPCPYCGTEMVDDDDDLGFSHLYECPLRPKPFMSRWYAPIVLAFAFLGALAIALLFLSS